MSPPRQKKFRASKEVKRRARRELGSPPPTRRHESRKHKRPKHKQQQFEEDSGQPCCNGQHQPRIASPAVSARFMQGDEKTGWPPWVLTAQMRGLAEGREIRPVARARTRNAQQRLVIDADILVRAALGKRVGAAIESLSTDSA